MPQLARVMFVESVIQYEEGVLPVRYRDSESEPDRAEIAAFKSGIFSSMRDLVTATLAEADISSRDYVLEDFGLLEHYNTGFEALAKLARVNFTVNHSGVLSDQFIDKSREFSRNLAKKTPSEKNINNKRIHLG